jgi:hypothetical protein
MDRTMTDAVAQPIDPHRCPLCGGPNGCACAAAGRGDHPCWCVQLKFDAQLLARVPEPLRGRACICRNCAETAQR